MGFPESTLPLFLEVLGGIASMGIYQVVAKQTLFAQQIRNVFYYETVGPLSAAQKQELADVLRVAWATLETAATLTDEWSLDGIYIRDVASGGIPGIDLGFTGGVLSGSSAVIPSPAQVGLLVIGRSGTVTPNQVRTYLCGWVSTQLGGDGLWQAAFVEDAFDWAVDMDTLVLTGETGHRVAAHWTAGEDPFVDDTNELTAYVAKPNPVTQKRRRIGRGA